MYKNLIYISLLSAIVSCSNKDGSTFNVGAEVPKEPTPISSPVAEIPKQTDVSKNETQYFDLSFSNKAVLSSSQMIDISSTHYGDIFTAKELEKSISCDFYNRKNSSVFTMNPNAITASEFSDKESIPLIFDVNSKISENKLNITIFDISKIHCKFDKENLYKKLHSEWTSIDMNVNFSQGDFGFKSGGLQSQRYLYADIFFNGEGTFTATTSDIILCLGFYQNSTWIELLPTEKGAITFSDGIMKTLTYDLDNAYIGTTKIDKRKISQLKCNLKAIAGLVDTSTNNNKLSSENIIW